MTLGRTWAVGLVGITGRMVQVEADVGAGLPTFTVGGLPDAACAQAADRIRAATANAGLQLPSRKVVVNLSPADLRKRGTGYDLGITLAILAAAGRTTNERSLIRQSPCPVPRVGSKLYSVPVRPRVFAVTPS